MPWQVWKTRAAVRVLVLLLGPLGLALSSAPSAHAQPITCGATLGPGGSYQLEEDLTCMTRTSGLRLVDGAILNMNGHTLTCNSEGPVGCLHLRGTATQAWNGTVRGAHHRNILLDDGGHHLLWHMTVGSTDGSLVILSDYNHLVHVTAAGEHAGALIVYRDHNTLMHTTLSCSHTGLGCLRIHGEENRLSQTQVTAGRLWFWNSTAVVIDGDRNLLVQTTVVNDLNPGKGTGFSVSGTGNTVVMASSRDMEVDAEDLHGDCTQNTWQLNTFTTTDPACLRNPMPRGLGFPLLSGR